MLIGTLAIYIAILLMVWGFFIVARIHTMKFKDFSIHIVGITNFLMIFLIILSISGFIFIFYLNSDNSNYELNIKENNVEEKEQNRSFKEEIIGDEYY